VAIDRDAVTARLGHYSDRHRKRAANLTRLEGGSGDVITPEFLTACVRKAIGHDTIVLSEDITSYPAISDHIGRTQPGTLFTSGGGSLGWNGGAAAAAGGAFALKVSHPTEIEAAIVAGLKAIQDEGRAAVLDVELAPL
jgi:thiamine pyrophosphate-dependent acetolactate synthase large subunit-like protein